MEVLFILLFLCGQGLICSREIGSVIWVGTQHKNFCCIYQTVCCTKGIKLQNQFIILLSNPIVSSTVREKFHLVKVGENLVLRRNPKCNFSKCKSKFSSLYKNYWIFFSFQLYQSLGNIDSTIFSCYFLQKPKRSENCCLFYWCVTPSNYESAVVRFKGYWTHNWRVVGFVTLLVSAVNSK